MPNKLKYCGSDRNRELFEYCAEKKTDLGLIGLLQKFETMYPYLRLIAYENDIPDPLDRRVVEAYWVGNELLENVSMKQLYRWLLEEQGLKKKFTRKDLELIVGKIPQGAKVHHSFHVLNIWFKNKKWSKVVNVLETMNNCMISWGKIKEIWDLSFIVERTPLVLKEGKLSLGSPLKTEILRKFEDKGFTENARVNNYVSIHWGWACDVLTPYQLQNLKSYTQHHINLANLTI